MANNNIRVYKLSEKERKAGRHSFTVDGMVYKVDKYGVLRVPDPGLPSPEAHGCEHVGVEGPGLKPWVDEAELVKHRTKRMEELAQILEGQDKGKLLAEMKKRNLEAKDLDEEGMRSALLEDEAELLEKQTAAAKS